MADLSLILEEAWREAQRRAEVIRSLQGPCPLCSGPSTNAGRRGNGQLWPKGKKLHDPAGVGRVSLLPRGLRGSPF